MSRNQPRPPVPPKPNYKPPSDDAKLVMETQKGKPCEMEGSLLSVKYNTEQDTSMQVPVGAVDHEGEYSYAYSDTLLSSRWKTDYIEKDMERAESDVSEMEYEIIYVSNNTQFTVLVSEEGKDGERSLLVSNLPDPVPDEDYLTMFFERKRHFGRELTVEKLEMDSLNHLAIVTFEDADDAKLVIETHKKKHFEIKGRRLLIQIYMEQEASVSALSGQGETDNIEVRSFSDKTSEATHQPDYKNEHPCGGGDTQLERLKQQTRMLDIRLKQQTRMLDMNSGFFTNPTEHKYVVDVNRSELSKACGIEGMITCVIENSAVVFRDLRTDQVKYSFPITWIRRFGLKTHMFHFEVGRRCPNGPGLIEISRSPVARAIYHSLVKIISNLARQPVIKNR